MSKELQRKLICDWIESVNLVCKGKEQITQEEIFAQAAEYMIEKFLWVPKIELISLEEIDKMFDAAEQAFNHSRNSFLGTNVSYPLPQIRSCLISYMRDIKGMEFSNIGRVLGNRSASVIKNCYDKTFPRVKDDINISEKFSIFISLMNDKE